MQSIKPKHASRIRSKPTIRNFHSPSQPRVFGDISNAICVVPVQSQSALAGKNLRRRRYIMRQPDVVWHMDANYEPQQPMPPQLPLPLPPSLQSSKLNLYSHPIPFRDVRSQIELRQFAECPKPPPNTPPYHGPSSFCSGDFNYENLNDDFIQSRFDEDDKLLKMYGHYDPRFVQVNFPFGDGPATLGWASHQTVQSNSFRYSPEPYFQMDEASSVAESKSYMSSSTNRVNFPSRITLEGSSCRTECQRIPASPDPWNTSNSRSTPAPERVMKPFVPNPVLAKFMQEVKAARAKDGKL